MTEDLSTLAKRLKSARQVKQWTQEQLAKEAGVSQSTIGNLEAESRARPRNLLQIASALGVSAVWLEFGTGEREASNPGLRADVAELAEILQRFDADQVAELRRFVLSIKPR